jgi:hypothetical protein
MSWFLRMILFALPAILLVYIYAGWRLTAALGKVTSLPRLRVRRIVQLAIGYLLLYPLLLLSTTVLNLPAVYEALRSGHRWADVFFVFPFWIGLIVFAEFLPLLLIIDLPRFVLWPLFQKHRPAWMKWQARFTVGIFILLVCYVAIRIFIDTYSVRLTKGEMQIPNLPAELNGFRLVQLSDLQADPYTDVQKMQRYIDLANSQNPDLIVFSGDLVTRGINHISQGAKMMGQLRARLGIYSCLGDHDYWADPQAVAQQLNENHVLTVEDSVLAFAENKISLTILTNVYNRRPAMETLQHLRQQRNENAAVHLVLAHQPTAELIEFVEENGYHLLLAGHTHGGQIVFKPFGIPLSVSHAETRYYSGFYQIGHLWLSVTNGLGLTLAPFRYQAPAEVTFIVLKRKA